MHRQGVSFFSTAAASAGWTRPSDWPAMPTSVANYIDVLVEVTDDDSNFCAVNVTVVGGYTVDWGDGTIENVASATQKDHKYTYSTLAAGITSRGYKTAMIRLYPQAANNITAFDIGAKNATAGLGAYNNPWLDVQVNAPACTSMAFRGGVDAGTVERINIIAIGAVTSLSATFQNCYNLQSITFPTGSLGSITTLNNAFATCVNLKSISFPTGSLSLVNTLAGAFQGCTSLQSITFPAGSLSLVTSLASAFYNCRSIGSITFPDGSLGLVTTLSNAFWSCTSLISITFPAGSLGASVTTLANAFQNCTSLWSITFPTGSLSLVSTLASVFQGCASLQSITFPTGSLGSVTTTTNAFATCGSLKRITNCLIPVSFTLPCSISATELNEIYTSLPVVTSKTLTVSANYGYAASTQSIATGKGWTLA